MARKTEQYILLADDNGEPCYVSLSELAMLCERDENFAWKLEHDFQDKDYDGY